jgi:hypothetical protein
MTAALPDIVSPRWRDPGRWPAMTGPRYRLDGFFTPAAAAELLERVCALPFTRLDFDVVCAAWSKPAASLGTAHDLLLSSAFRAAASSVLGVTLPEAMIVNAWHLSTGDHMRPHRDSRHYVGAFCVGLCPDWSPARGGAIAFGPGSAAGITAEERWHPHLGDLLLFRPSPTSWHTVEPVLVGTRRSLSGWWTDPRRPDRWELP